MIPFLQMKYIIGEGCANFRRIPDETETKVNLQDSGIITIITEKRLNDHGWYTEHCQPKGKDSNKDSPSIVP